MGTYSLIKQVNPGTFYLNATDNRFDTEIFFSTEEVDKTHFFSDLYEEIEGLDEVVTQCLEKSNNYDLWIFFGEHKDEILEIASSNEEYMDYLMSKECSLEDLSNYITKMANIDNYVIKVAVYITFVCIGLGTIWVFKYRKGFYITAAVVYLIAMTSVFSDGLTDYLVSAFFSFFAEINKETFTYVDMELMNTFFLNTVKEALMTVVIFDTIFEFRNSSNEIQKQKNIRYVFATMDVQILYLKEHMRPEFEFIGKIKIPTYNLEKLCNKEVVNMRKVLKHQKVRNSYYYKYKARYEINRDLLEHLLFLRTNSEKNVHVMNIYIMNRVKELMILGGYTKI